MWRTASMASRFSVSDTGSPAARSSWMKPASTSNIVGLLRRDGQLFGRPGDVAAVLEQDVQRLLGQLGVDGVDAEQQQRARPVERLRHRRCLLQLELADRTH